MLPVNSVLPGSFSHPMLPKSILSPMHFPNSLPSILVSSQKKISFGLLSFATRSSSFGETLLLYQHLRLPCPPPTPIHRMERIQFLGCFALFQSSFSIHYHYSILRSSFFVLLFLGISKTDPYPLLPSLPMSDCVSLMRACVWLALWFGMGSDSLDQSTAHFFPSPVLYYLHITGDSVY